MKIRKLADLKVGMHVRTLPPAKRFDLGDIELASPIYVWKITKNDGKQIVLHNEHESVEVTLPRDHVRIHAFHHDPEGSDGILVLNCQIRIKLGQVNCELIRR